MTDEQLADGQKAERRQILVDVMREALRLGGLDLLEVVERLRAHGARHADLVELAGRAGYSAADLDVALYEAEELEVYE